MRSKRLDPYTMSRPAGDREPKRSSSMFDCMNRGEVCLLECVERKE